MFTLLLSSISHSSSDHEGKSTFYWRHTTRNNYGRRVDGAIPFLTERGGPLLQPKGVEMQPSFPRCL